MANVKLIKDWGDHKAGEILSLPATVARSLIFNEDARGGNIHESSGKPLDGTIPDLRKWLDDNEVEYDATARKPELIELVKNA